VERGEALARIQAACDARREYALDILILARTDARQTHGLEEALERCRLFRELGADITFLEAPESELEMQRYCALVPGPKMANMLARGKTPSLPPARLGALGFSLVAYPLDLLVAATQAMQATLEQLKRGVEPPQHAPEAVELVWQLSGFRAYQRDELRYAPGAAGETPRSCTANP
jgi:2-methylisocitrate lyase-like PEP mutase family enzyme